jgi:hypothetical protein
MNVVAAYINNSDEIYIIKKQEYDGFNGITAQFEGKKITDRAKMAFKHGSICNDKNLTDFKHKILPQIHTRDIFFSNDFTAKEISVFFKDVESY